MAWLRRRRRDRDHIGDQHVPASQTVNPLLRAWADVVDVSGVSDQLAADIDNYLRSVEDTPWSWRSRRELGFRLADVVSSHVSPPPPEFINPLDVLATVLTLRERQRGGGTSPNVS
jgi:hypothetical protein